MAEFARGLRSLTLGLIVAASSLASAAADGGREAIDRELKGKSGSE